MNNQNNQEILTEDDVITWKIKERGNEKKDKRWYLLAGVVGLAMFIYAALTANFIFAIILVFAAFLVIFSDQTEKQSFEVSLSDHGVQVGKEFYTYEQLEDFFIVYRPEENIKNLYIHFKRFARPSLPENEPKGFSWLIFLLNFSRSRFSIPLEDMNPLLIRKNLLKYLKENAERTDIPLSERLSSLFRF
ncbi:MAG: hypothetical protein WC415_02805 [Patescibacteria group bacterium]|jgi:hypothetical protein